MIRILHSVSNMDRAGVETMLMNYYRYIDREKIQFDFLCNKKKPGAYDDEIKKMGGRIYITPGYNPLRYKKYFTYMKKLFREHPEYKIVHAHNGALAYYPLKAANLSKIPIRIAHSHNTKINFDFKWPIKIYCKMQIKKPANYLYGCSKLAVKFYFGEDVLKKKKYTIINNAIEVERFLYNETIRAKIRQQYNLTDKIVIGHIGRFMYQKNHTFLVDIFESIAKEDKNAVLMLAGDGELVEKTKEKVHALGLDKKVIFTGNVSNVNELYQAMDLFILPSLYEGLPVVGIEAQTAGLPCIFSNTITEEVAITENVKFLDLKKSSSEWAKEVICILKQSVARKNMYEEITNKGYNIKIEAKKLQEKYIEMYEKIVEKEDK